MAQKLISSNGFKFMEKEYFSKSCMGKEMDMLKNLKIVRKVELITNLKFRCI